MVLWFWRWVFFNVVNVFPFYLPLENGVVLHLNNLEPPLPKDALCYVWLNEVQWSLKRWNCEKLTDRQMMDNRGSWKFTQALSSGELKQCLSSDCAVNWWDKHNAHSATYICCEKKGQGGEGFAFAILWLNQVVDNKFVPLIQNIIKLKNNQYFICSYQKNIQILISNTRFILSVLNHVMFTCEL